LPSEPAEQILPMLDRIANVVRSVRGR
jgi:hypothetical protein